MTRAMIRTLRPEDLEAVMALWLYGNEEAHSFIDKAYWCSHYDEVRAAISQAEVYVFDEDGTVRGFIGIVDGYIAGIFVERGWRSKGIGRRLLQAVKEKYETLTLDVYQKNERAIKFYQQEGFAMASCHIEEDTGESDVTMIWKR